MDRYQKQILFHGVGEEGQKRLLESRVAVIGCGALGSVIAQTLARAGVGHLRIVDRDFVDLSNLQRQVLYDEKDVQQRLPKAVAAQRKLSEINSEIEIEAIVADVHCGNILELIKDADLILDGTDNFEIRFLINDASVESSIPWVHAGCVGSHGQVMTILPGETPCLRCLMPEIPDPGSAETCDTAGVLASAIQVVASLQVVEAIKYLTGQPEQISRSLTIVDVWDGSLRKLDTSQLNQAKTCPCCSGKDRVWLRGDRGSHSTVLCGRNAVQFTPSTEMRLAFSELEKRLASQGSVRNNSFLLIFKPSSSDHELTIFQNGRAIISGTEDLVEARAIYTRYIGQ
ncbi:Sulfur carrier protein ThiS adenylyltransferase [Thalassoglobus neptunius]|uniref:Sulfur carrier protein ThiS adenylyltransferase n=1 Tax=Thalassoglobus neptunius TaxID=1938619 RepID=A0A5C5X6I3_9PLAN|nr:ThiF family adenylyltransferase [Thalassoglobus neptunius]TWT58540.1 Sulfur carrier protein ThiS adenylyltransferase [Thalassoglobus neptunius]